MNSTELTTLIGSLGFPIVACAALFWQQNTLTKMYQEQIEKLSDVIREHTASIQALITTVKDVTDYDKGN